MNDFNNDKDSRLEKIQKKLYQKKFEQKKSARHNLDLKEYEMESDWEEAEEKGEKTNADFSDLIDEPKKKGLGFFGYVMIFAVIFFIASVSYASFIFFGGSQTISANEVDINISGPVSVAAGEVLPLDLIIQNNNPVPLEAVDLIITYPNGTKSAENLIDPLNRVRERIDDINSGTLTRETIKAALFGDEGDNKEISVKVEYQVPGSNAIFSKEKVFSVILNAAPARISVNALKEISSGQEIELEATITSNSTSELKNLIVTANYPFGFDFIEADVEPTFSDDVWIIDSLSPNEEKIIKIKGTITGQNEEDRVFRFNTGLVSDDNPREIGVIFNNYIHELVVKRPFVGLDLKFNGSDDAIYIADSGERIRTELVFANNTNDIVRNLKIRLKIEGVAFDESSITARDAFYRSADNTLIFDSESNSYFEEISPRNDIRTSFDFKLVDLVNSGIDIKNPEVKITALLEGERISGNNVEQEINETSTRLIKVMSNVFIGTYTLRDAGPFENTGPIPPKAEQETTYTLTWSVSNSSNNLENASLTAVIPQYVFWSNKVSPSNENWTYDERTRRLTWNIGNVPAGTGTTYSAKELSFQVALFPSLSQVGDVPNLLREPYFTATDIFTDTKIKFLTPVPNTKLTNGSTINRHGIVVE